MTDLAWLTAGEIEALYRSRALSPVELVSGLLDRIAALEPQVHAFTLLDPEDALRQARAAEVEFAAGRYRGPLHGVPVGLKDIIDVAGQRTSCHSRLMLEHRASADATVVSRLRQAGAILMGKLSTHELAIGGPSFDLPFPPARNPWNLACHPGGSSSGPGAGLGAGFFPLALGTDTGGSIRHPAAACGVVGLKPTYGLVPRGGVFPLAWTLDHVGPMARSVRDAALLLEVLAGAEVGDASGIPAPAEGFTAGLDAGIAGMRIGFVRGFHERDVVASPEMATALEEAARVLSGLGAELRTVELPPLPEFAAVNRVILTSEAWAVHAEGLRHRARDYGALSRRRVLVGAFLSAGDLVQAQRRRRQLTAVVNEALREVDVLLVANSMDPPCAIDDEDEITHNYGRQARTPFNLTGHPAIAVMTGLSSAGLPLSCQLVGPLREDGLVLRVAAAFEAATEWHRRHPALGARAG